MSEVSISNPINGSALAETGAGHEHLSPVEESRLFWRLRWSILRTILRQAFQEARLRTSLILLLTAVFWFGMYLLFREGFQILRSMITHEGTRAATVHAIFNVFYFTLLLMIMMSSGILFYSFVFRSRETDFLMSCPVTPERIVIYKWQESLIISCWGFLLLGSPLLLAYGTTSGSPWYFYPLTLPFLVSFAFIPVSCGAIACLAVVRYGPVVSRRTAIGLAAVFVSVVGVGSALVLRSLELPQGMSMDWFQGMLARMKYTEQPWLPSWWLSTGLLEAAHPAQLNDRKSWIESIGFLSTLGSTAMVLYLCVAAVGNRLLPAAKNRVAGLGAAAKLASMGWFDWVIATVSRPLPKAMRLLVIKDFKIFRRDALQWTQLAIFCGLLCFYFVNIRRLQYGSDFRSWMMVVGYLNVAVIGLLLGSFTTRFIYPLISLEGRRFWILGTLPIRRSTIVWGKFLFACMISVLPCCLLVLLSDVMLAFADRSLWILAMHQLTCLAQSCGLCALAVGMGAQFPDLREPSPAKISSGFGGTMTLVLSVAFILLIVSVNGVATCGWMHYADGDIDSDWFARSHWTEYGTFASVILGALITVILGLVATISPLQAGIRHLQRIEP